MGMLVMVKKFSEARPTSLKMIGAAVVKTAVAVLMMPLVVVGGPAKSIKMDIGNRGAKIELMLCPAGEYTMGFNRYSVDKKDDLKWQTVVPHKVRITRPFWLSKYPVTYAQFKMLCPSAFAKIEPRRIYKDKNGKIQSEWHDWKPLLSEYGEDMAMSCVTYSDAEEFMQALAKRFPAKIPKGYVLRLPTEAEFEYALKEGGKIGDMHLHNTGRFNPGSKSTPVPKMQRRERFQTAANSEGFADYLSHFGCTVGKDYANRWGLHDMMGNVSFWTLDTIRRGEKLDIPTGYFNTVRTDPLFMAPHDNAESPVLYPSFEGDASSKATKVLGGRERWLGFRICLGPDLVSEKEAKRKQAQAKMIDPFMLLD